MRVSAKTGAGVPELLEAADPPHPGAQGRCRGAAAGADHRLLVRQLRGRGFARARDERRAEERRADPRHVHRAQPSASTSSVASRRSPWSLPELATGDVGFVVAGIKEIDGAPVGDTITLEHRPSPAALPGFKQIKPRVFAGLFPVNSEDYESFRDALAKLRLNDSALHYEPEVSGALGFGFRCGFLGLLHMDIVQERLEREYSLDARDQRADGGLRSGAHRRRGRATWTIRRSCRR